MRWRGGERGNTERDEDEAAEEEGGKRESRKRFAGAPAGHTHTHSHTESHLPASAVPEHHHSIAVIHVGARWRTTRYGVKRWQSREGGEGSCDAEIIRSNHRCNRQMSSMHRQINWELVLWYSVLSGRYSRRSLLAVLADAR